MPPSSASRTSATSSRTARSRRRSSRAPQDARRRAAARGASRARAGRATRSASRLADGRDYRAGLVVGADGAESAVRPRGGHRSARLGLRAARRRRAPRLPERPHARDRLAALPRHRPDRAAAARRWARLARLVHDCPRSRKSLAALRPKSEFCGARDRGLRRACSGRLAPAARRAPPFRCGCCMRSRYAADAHRAGRRRRACRAPAGGPGHQPRLPGCRRRSSTSWARRVAAGDDPGELRVLRRYERWRKAEALPAIALLDGIKRLFSGGDGDLQSRLRQGLPRARPVLAAR